MKRWRIAGINFDHFHMGDLLRQASEHPDVGDRWHQRRTPERMVEAARNFDLVARSSLHRSTAPAWRRRKPDIVILCPAASRHGEWVDKVAPFGTHIIMEKPFAGSLAEADEMVAAMKPTGKLLAINWPLVWSAGHQTAHRLIQEGLIGEVREFHHSGGNRGPLYHGADKIDKEPTAEEKAASWFYSKALGRWIAARLHGLRHDAGHLASGRARSPWRSPAPGTFRRRLDVDEHAVAVIRYAFGLSKTETRWGTFTDPWTHQPQPVCGFVIKGTDGTISIPDYCEHLACRHARSLRASMFPVEPLSGPNRNPIEHVIHHLETGVPLIGPLTIEISRIGQQIVDTAFASATAKRTLPLIG